VGAEVSLPKSSERLQVASILQASGFRSDVTVFRLNARSRPKAGSEPAFRRNTAAWVYTIEAAHNPEVAGSNPAPATSEGPGDGAFLLRVDGSWENVYTWSDETRTRDLRRDRPRKRFPARLCVVARSLMDSGFAAGRRT
jgi:hypothetical protein